MLVVLQTVCNYTKALNMERKDLVAFFENTHSIE